MALNGLLDIQIAVPNPQELFDFWLQHGMSATSDGVLGTPDRPIQMQIAEGSYRHLSSMHLSCDTEADITAIAKRLAGAGIASTSDSTTLRCVDPVFGHSIVIDVGSPHSLTPTQTRAFNGPGERTRVNTRADAVLHTESPIVRRVGHVVLGTPHLAEAVDFYSNVLGYRISDQIMKGFATFMRVESDHHNLMIQPGPTSYLNHYAVEVDDIDAVGLAGSNALKDEVTRQLQSQKWRFYAQGQRFCLIVCVTHTQLQILCTGTVFLLTMHTNTADSVHRDWFFVYYSARRTELLIMCTGTAFLITRARDCIRCQ
jgi:catechol 2,3-dioxygenase-like lactoylglutathione lyase family enzyme